MDPEIGNIENLDPNEDPQIIEVKIVVPNEDLKIGDLPHVEKLPDDGDKKVRFSQRRLWNCRICPHPQNENSYLSINNLKS